MLLCPKKNVILQHQLSFATGLNFFKVLSSKIQQI